MATLPYSRPLAAGGSVSKAVPAAASHQPPGTFAPNTKVQVGQHRVIIDRYLSEGGFAHVYVVRIPRDGGKQEVAVLKRVAVPDKESLANMKTEVDTMKKLKGHKRIVTYIDSHASQLKGGGYEVFLLMEFCAGGGLIDFMNTRLQHRLTEPEILHIFTDVAEGVATMHYLKPPLLHRDLKVENVLISTAGTSRIYKICDFGSTAPPRPAATNAAEGRLIEDDVQRHTTMQYRSPEMIDVYRKQPINEKSDIWALGVLLYKLCYYTTPFEEQGTMAILNATFRFPPHPQFSERLRRLISWMLKENPQSRPNIYQVLKESCAMRGKECPIKDIYSARTQSEARRYEQLPQPTGDQAAKQVVGLQKVAPAPAKQNAVPEVAPMRRGRPKAHDSHPAVSSLKAPGGDPFAALDAKNYDTRAAAVDELSSKYPSLDQFSLIHNQDANFRFTPKGAVAASPPQEQLNKRVTEALADEAFAKASSSQARPVSGLLQSVPRTSHDTDGPLQSRQKDTQVSSSGTAASSQKPAMVSTGTMTSPVSSPNLPAISSQKPIWRVPQTKLTMADDSQPLSQYRSVDSADLELPPRPEARSSRPRILDRTRTKSQSGLLAPKASLSARTSMEGSPTMMDGFQPADRARSASARPVSSYVESNIDYLRTNEKSRSRASSQGKPLPDTPKQGGTSTGASSDVEGPDDHITSDVDFLKSIESNEDGLRKRNSLGRSGSGKNKRASIPSISLSGTKTILAGKFGDAFRRFEATGNGTATTTLEIQRSETEHLNAPLSPITGSSRTGTSARSDDVDNEEAEQLPPEVRRELERRRLSQEEKRVAAAAAEYRQRMEKGERASAGPSKASSIQSRVKTLLDDSKPLAVSRTAEGYGKYTDGGKLDRPTVPRKPMVTGAADRTGSATAIYPPRSPVPPAGLGVSLPLRTAARPNVAPKPKAFRTGGPTIDATLARSSPVADDEEWDAKFRRRYPSLSGIELVEAEIGNGHQSPRIRDV